MRLVPGGEDPVEGLGRGAIEFREVVGEAVIARFDGPRSSRSGRGGDELIALRLRYELIVRCADEGQW